MEILFLIAAAYFAMQPDKKTTTGPTWPGTVGSVPGELLAPVVPKPMPAENTFPIGSIGYTDGPKMPDTSSTPGLYWHTDGANFQTK